MCVALISRQLSPRKTQWLSCCEDNTNRMSHACRKHVHVKNCSQPSGTVSTAVSQRPLTNAAMTFLQHLYVALHNQMWYVILPQYLDSGVMHDVQDTNWGKLSPEHHWRSEWHTYALMFLFRKPLRLVIWFSFNQYNGVSIRISSKKQWKKQFCA